MFLTCGNYHVHIINPRFCARASQYQRTTLAKNKKASKMIQKYKFDALLIDEIYEAPMSVAEAYGVQ